jgi:hypothetical protein
MTTFNPRRLLVLASALMLTATAAQAQGKSKEAHGKKGHDNKAAKVKTDDRIVDGRIIDRGVIHDQGGRKVPPGLAKKPGQMPPGQYKKRYSTSEGSSILRDVLGRRGYTVLRTENAGDSQYVYYRMADGSIRRAVVSQNNDQVHFGGNLPATLLREILGRL